MYILDRTCVVVELISRIFKTLLCRGCADDEMTETKIEQQCGHGQESEFERVLILRCRESS